MRIHFCLSLFYAVAVFSQCLDHQKSLLLHFKNNLVFDSAMPLDWDQNVDCCQWEGITCDGSSGHVIGLELFNKSISGALDSRNGLFRLQHLQKLNLAWNDFNSIPIPTGIENLASLTQLNLSNAGFAGQIPIELSKLTNLVSLDLSCEYELPLPLKLENPDLKMLVQNLTLLQEIYLDSVNISTHGLGWYDAVFSSLPKLRNLSLRGCSLSGDLLLSHSLSKLQSLSVLQLDMNNLPTSIPDFFSNFSGLTILTLCCNSLQGTFPDKIFSILTLQYLDLSFNSLLEGTIPQFPSNASFRTIVLSYTSFSGSLPPSISNLNKLSRIELSNCNFNGSIPRSIVNLKQLEALDLSNNQLTGEIPKELIGLKFLSFLNLSYNRLVGMIPNSGQFLTFSSESFEGNIGLCGFALHRSCSPDGPAPKSYSEIEWKFISPELGFCFGLALVFFPLLFWKRWRENYWRHADQFLKLVYPRYGSR